MPTFDICLMNPPYANKLHEKFLIKTVEFATKGVSIQPAVWLNKGNKNRKSFQATINALNGRISNIELISHEEINKLFNTGNSIQDGAIISWEETSALNLKTFGYSNELEKSLFEKTNIDNNSEMTLIRGGGYRYTDKLDRDIKSNECPIYQWHNGKTCYDAVVIPENLWDKKASLVLVFNNSGEVENFKNSLKTKFANWFFKNYVVPGDYKILTYMFRMKDYSKPWTDERFYKMLNLTKEEITIIEEDITY